MAPLHKHEGSAEDTQGIFAAFEKYLMKIMKLISDE